MIRVIAHVDMDCFYCQVEQKRLGIPATSPLAVQQWNMVIAVNYAARAAPYSIKRGMSAAECRSRCPDIHLVHVEVLDTSNAASAGPESLDSMKEEDSQLFRRDNVSKASLERYRRASEEIMSVFSRFIPLCERASIDEAYFDLTEIAELREKKHTIDFETLDNKESILNTIPPHTINVYTSRIERRYAVAAVIVSEIRAAVFSELGYTVSAGIAGNKMIAKQASAAFKPNRQTIIPPDAVLSLISDIPIRDVRGLGGKMGQEVISKLQVQTLGEIRSKYTTAELNKILGSKCGHWLYNICYGNDEEPVKSNLIPKSLLAFKSFETVDSNEEVERWLELLCSDVLNRMKGDMIANHRKPRGLMVWHRAGNSRGGGRDGAEATRSGPMPLPSVLNLRSVKLTEDLEQNMSLVSTLLPSLPELMKAALGLLSRVASGNIAPCCRLGVGACDFIEVPYIKPNSSNSSNGIDNFFARSSNASASKPRKPSIPASNSSSSSSASHSDIASATCDEAIAVVDPNDVVFAGYKIDDFRAEYSFQSTDSSYAFSDNHSNLSGLSASRAPACPMVGNRSLYSKVILNDASPNSQINYQHESGDNNCSSRTDGGIRCKKCSIILPIDPVEAQTHMDEHLAMELSAQLNGVPLVSTISSCSSSNNHSNSKSGNSNLKRKLQPITDKSLSPTKPTIPSSSSHQSTLHSFFKKTKP